MQAVSEDVTTQESPLRSHSFEEKIEVTVDQSVPRTNIRDGASADMTILTVNESDEKPTGAGTNVDHPRELCPDIHNGYLSIGR